MVSSRELMAKGRGREAGGGRKGMGYAVPKMVNVSVQAEHFRYAAFLANLKSNLSSAFVTHVSRAPGRATTRGRGR